MNIRLFEKKFKKFVLHQCDFEVYLKIHKNSEVVRQSKHFLWPGRRFCFVSRIQVIFTPDRLGGGMESPVSKSCQQPSSKYLSGETFFFSIKPDKTFQNWWKSLWHSLALKMFRDVQKTKFPIFLGQAIGTGLAESHWLCGNLMLRCAGTIYEPFGLRGVKCRMNTQRSSNTGVSI